jgi:hypothetical protein
MGSWSTGGANGMPSQLGGKYVLVLPYETDVARRAAVDR